MLIGEDFPPVRGNRTPQEFFFTKNVVFLSHTFMILRSFFQILRIVKLGPPGVEPP